ncbi:MAG: hypothetical protein ACP5RT_02645 [Candidatus Micrarchaeia archaeon]
MLRRASVSRSDKSENKKTTSMKKGSVERLFSRLKRMFRLPKNRSVGIEKATAPIVIE